MAKIKFGWRDLLRISLWAISAAAAMAIAVYSGSTSTGHDRLQQAFAEFHETIIPSGVKQARPLDAREGRRLAETVQVLVADSERLVARIATLEQSLDSVTGTIAKVEKSIQVPVPPPEVKAPPPEIKAPPVQPPEEVTSSVSPPPASEALPPPAHSPNAAKTEFGVDLGNASSVEALRTAWTLALRRHAVLLQGLRPLVQTRERPRAAGTEFRLIAGPIANAAAAARICATLTASGAVCAPAVFDGQRLAVR